MFKKFIFLFLFLLVFSSFAKQLTESRINPAYLRYLQLKEQGELLKYTQDGHLVGGYIPPKYDLNYELSREEKTDLLQKAASLPAKFDPRTDNTITAVRNQGGCGSCWAFGSLAAVESRLIKLGYGPIDLSENHLNQLNNPCQGGHYPVTTAYFSKMQGPVYESDDPYKGSSGSPNNSLTPRYFIPEARILPHQANADANLIKQTLYDYGAMYTSLWWSDGSYDQSDQTFYWNEQQSGGHAVTIVGWDDNRKTKKGTGAWIIRNSWGDSFGDGGYFYIPYEDTKKTLDSYCYWPNIEAYNSQSKIYGSLAMESMYQFQNGFEIVNKIPITENTTIQKVIYNAGSGSSVEFKIYKNFDGSSFSNEIASGSNSSISVQGTFATAVTSPVEVSSGETVYLYFKLQGSGNVDLAINTSPLYDSWYNEGGSWYKMDGYTAAVALYTSPVSGSGGTSIISAQITKVLPQTIKPGETVYVTAKGTDSQNKNLSIMVDWGDGSVTDYGSSKASGEEFSFTHVYNSSKTYKVKVRAKNSDGTESPWSSETQIVIGDPPQGRFVEFTGADLGGTSRTIKVYEHTDGKYYPVWDIGSFDLSKSTMPNKPYGGIIVYSCHLGNPLPINAETNTWTTEQVSALYNAKMVSDFIDHNKFQFQKSNQWIAWQGYNGEGSAMKLMIQYEPAGAHGHSDIFTWDGVNACLGAGNTKYNSLAGGLDIVTRTMFNSMIQNTSKLERTQTSESGAIYDHLLDFFAVCVDSANYTIGEGVTKDGKAIWNFSDPADANAMYQLKDSYNQFISKKHLLKPEEQDQLPHLNSGILNKAAAQVIASIGRSRAAKIWWNANLTLSRQATFQNFANALVNTANQIDSEAASTISSAFQSVGISVSTEPTNAKASISGTIKDNNGNNLSGVTVTLYKNDESKYVDATTDDQGYYYFGNLPDQYYKMIPSKTNYTFTPADSIFQSLSSSKTVNFTGTASSSGGNTYTIKGTIATSEGTGVKEVTVYAKNITDNTSTYSQTNLSGYYEFGGLGEGKTFVIQPKMEGYTFSPDSQKFENLNANQTQNFTTAASSGGITISGYIKTSNGTAISNCWIGLYQEGEYAISEVYSDSEGKYQFTGLNEGQYYMVYPWSDTYSFDPQYWEIQQITSSQTVDFTASANSGLTKFLDTRELLESPAESKSVIAFSDENGQVCLYDVAQETVTSYSGTSATVYFDPEGSDRSQLSSTRDGNHLYFVNSNSQVSYIDLSTDSVYAFDWIYVDEPGDVISCVVSPDEDFVLAVSAYDNDPNLYIFDPTDTNVVYYVPLSYEDQVEGGITIPTIRYADAIDCYASDIDLKFAFDALNQQVIGEADTLLFFAIYEIDLSADNPQVINFYPSQKEKVDLGYVKYSKQDKSMITFNYWDYTDTNDIYIDVYVAQFDNKDAGNLTEGYLGIPYYVGSNGSMITDPLFPEFSPNDSLLVMSSFETSSMLFYDLSTKQLTKKTMNKDVYKPHWFMMNTGQSDIEEPAAIDESSEPQVDLECYPNPLNTSAVAKFYLPGPNEISIKLYDILGKEIQTVFQGSAAAGWNAKPFNLSRQGSGTYLMIINTETFGKKVIKLNVVR